MQNQAPFAKATKAEKARIGFYIHFASYVVVNLLLLAINLGVTPDRLWFKWPLLGWGIGVFFHALAVFVLSTAAPHHKRMIEPDVKK